MDCRLAECEGLKFMLYLSGAQPRRATVFDERYETTVWRVFRVESGGEGSEQDKAWDKRRLRSSVRNQHDGCQLGGPHHHLELWWAETNRALHATQAWALQVYIRVLLLFLMHDGVFINPLANLTNLISTLLTIHQSLHFVSMLCSVFTAWWWPNIPMPWWNSASGSWRFCLWHWGLSLTRWGNTSTRKPSASELPSTTTRRVHSLSLCLESCPTLTPASSQCCSRIKPPVWKSRKTVNGFSFPQYRMRSLSTSAIYSRLVRI